MLYLFSIKHDIKRYEWKSRIFIAAITVIFILGFIHSNQEINSTFFLLLFPIASFSIRGVKEGILWSILVLMSFIALFTLNLDLYNGYSFFFFCCTYFMVSYLLYYYRHYELKIFEQVYKVHDLKNELEKSNQQLELLATTDKLTNIANRNKLDTILEEEFQRTQRFQHPFSIILLDIDHFKQVNDTHGHQIGDILLVELANLLKYYTRDTDTLGRWGGEEFMIICPETTKDGVYKLACNLQQKIDSHTFSTVQHKTASFGVTTYQLDDTLHSMIRRTDEALYQSKKNGRNQVQVQ